jgi:hypothetical protein
LDEKVFASTPTNNKGNKVFLGFICTTCFNPDLGPLQVSVIFEKLQKVSNRPMGENSPNLVTLPGGHLKIFLFVIKLEKVLALLLCKNTQKPVVSSYILLKTGTIKSIPELVKPSIQKVGLSNAETLLAHVGLRIFETEFRFKNRSKSFSVTGTRDGVAVVGVPDRRGQPHVVAGRAGQPAVLRRQRGGVDPAQVVHAGRGRQEMVAVSLGLSNSAKRVQVVGRLLTKMWKT